MLLTSAVGPILPVLAASEVQEPLFSVVSWNHLEHNYPNAKFIGVEFINTTYGWVVGQIGHNIPAEVIVLHTDDGGDSWEEQLSENEQVLHCIDVIDDRTVWVSGRSGLFHTDDGGRTWNMSIVVSGRSGLSVVEFINHTHGWTATKNTLYKTMDGGITWDSVPGWTIDDSPRELQFLSTLDVWAIGWFGIYHSEDGAETWEQVQSIEGRSFSFVSENEAWAVGDNVLMHMIDGSNWSEVVIPARAPVPRLFRPPYLSDIQFLDSNNGWIVGDEIPIMYTPDAGGNWYEQSVSEEVIGRLYSVCFVNVTHGWAVGSQGTILRTTEGNVTGSRLWFGFTDPIFLLIIGAVSVIIVSTLVLRRRFRRKSVVSSLEIT
ncbi:MAG: YCF48-related protein [Candidatus Thorarchaeota archaeon]